MQALDAILHDIARRSSSEDSASGATRSHAEWTARAPKARLVLPERFRLLGKLGQGGMGVVHRAFDTELGREVAIKSLGHPRHDDLYRLKREFRLLSDIRHPNLIRLHELFAEGNHAFFTMDLVIGQDFRSFVSGQAGKGKARSTCDYVRLRNLARQLASAIAAVHAAGKLHRDIKPSNIIVTPTGRVVLFDFGLAASLSARTAKTKAEGVLLGTRGYVAPEQARGEALTTSADWYGFGVTLFEAMTGSLPFADAYRAFLVNGAVDRFASVRDHLPDAPADLDELIAGLLDPMPERRPTEEEIFRVLGRAESGCKSVRRSVTTKPSASPGDERTVLRSVLARPELGRSMVVRMHGTHASKMARLFVEEAKADGAKVLRGKCRAREHVAFNALDEIVDDLSHHLEYMPHGELLSVLPANAAALPELFPVLGRLESSCDEVFARRPESNANTLTGARSALKDLLANLSDRRPLVLWIDDAEWGDGRSGELLKELLEPSDAPRMLVLLSCRSDDGLPQGGLLDALQRGESTIDFVDVPPGSSFAISFSTRSCA
jgi:serine/threonine protein kinase